jgi:hypothetical protein
MRGVHAPSPLGKPTGYEERKGLLAPGQFASCNPDGRLWPPNGSNRPSDRLATGERLPDSGQPRPRHPGGARALGHRSSAMINRYRRAARTWTELAVAPLEPLDRAIADLRLPHGLPHVDEVTSKRSQRLR